MTPAPISVERLRELLGKARSALQNVDDSACRCHEAWKDRGMKDPGCNCDTYDDIAALSALIDSEALPALLHQLAERDAEVERLKAQAEEDRELKLVAMEVAQDISTCIPFLPPIGQRNIRKCVDRLIAAFLAASGGK